MTSLVVADDQELVRAGLCRILDGEPDLEVLAQVGDGEAAVAVATERRPDVVLMDIRMPLLDGLAATRLIVSNLPGVRVVVLTTFDLDEYVYEALRSGASGFVLKDAPAEEIVRAVRAAAAGDALISPRITHRLIGEFASHRPRAVPQLELLTGREREVLAAMARGLNNAEVGRALYISEGTVRTHVNRMLAKLGARDRVQAVVLAYEGGLVRPGHTDTAQP